MAEAACAALRHPIGTLKRRPEFLRIRGGARWTNGCLVIESRPREPSDANAARVGYTVTKQLGNAAVRNRIRRRLREAMRLCDRALLEPGRDYVLIARAPSLQRGFGELRAELAAALERVNAVRPSGRPDKSRKRVDGAASG